MDVLCGAFVVKQFKPPHGASEARSMERQELIKELVRLAEASTETAPEVSSILFGVAGMMYVNAEGIAMIAITDIVREQRALMQASRN